MKNQKGITLISLVITIILIMILASISVNTGLETFETMSSQAFVAKMITVQEAVDKLCEKYTIDEIKGKGIGYGSAPTEAVTVLDNVIANSANLKSWNSSVDNIANNYIYFDINSINTILGIKDFDTAIWINPATRNIIAVKGIEYDDAMYYRQYDLAGGQTLSEANINVNFTLNYSVRTYDNKAEIILYKEEKKDDDTFELVETVFSKVKYYKQKDDGTYSDAISLNNVSKIPLNETGVYKIEATDSTGNTQRQESIVVTIVNKPLLADGMTPVKFVDSDADGAKDDMVDTTVDDQEWYNYAESGDVSKNWANAKLKDGSVFVWIPRYAYEIITEDDTSTADINEKNTINIKFLKEFSNIGTDGNALLATYKVAPAFKDGFENGYANGEWDSEITGIWVAKYEPINESTKPKIVAQYTQSWRELTLTNAFNYCRYMESTNRSTYFGDNITSASGTYSYGVYASDTNNIDTHLMKNSEWGAVAYLTHSKYGATVSKATNYYVKGTSTDATADGNTAPQYSSTNNYTGVYGLNGGAYEMVAAATNLLGYLNSENKSTKYATYYSTSPTSNNIYGDAVKETSGWNSNESSYLTTYGYYFRRGGYYSLTSGTGIFAYNGYSRTSTSSDTTFRPVLIVEY